MKYNFNRQEEKGVVSDAWISQCGLYRYWLGRQWDSRSDACSCVFLMLNPSTADAYKDDPTIRRCIGFAKSWDCGSMDVLNLFSLRATNPSGLRLNEDPIGPYGDEVLQGISTYDLIVAAWGGAAAI